MKENTYIEGGIYTNYLGIPAIYCGDYPDSTGKIRPSFIEIKNCPYTTNEEIVRHIRKVGTRKINDMIILAPISYTGYDYGYLGQIPSTLYTRIHHRVECWASMPIKSTP